MRTYQKCDRQYYYPGYVYAITFQAQRDQF